MTTAVSRPDAPLVSIVMPVKNGALYVCEAIDALLQQTCTDFELIVIDDGSTDATLELIKQFSDSRITVVSQENQGVARAANRGFALARGQYISRHDHDDISLPTRLAKQVAFLDNNPQCGLVGTRAQIWSGDRPTQRVHDHPSTPGVVAFALLFNAPFVNTSCLFRRTVLTQVGMYTTDPARSNPEDFEFFSRVARQFAVANLSERLVYYREVPNSHSSTLRSSTTDNVFQKDGFVARLALFSAENLAAAVGISATSELAKQFGNLVHFRFNDLPSSVDIRAVLDLVKQAATHFAREHHDDAVWPYWRERVQFLEYQYYTFMQSTFHWKRLRYLLRTRTWRENWASVRKLSLSA
jgi:glycosyltransferase involved in cell wall biosynthesis